MQSDSQLVDAWRGGEQAAFERLYARYRQPLYRYLLYSCKERTVADELFQDVWTRIVDHRDRYRHAAGFKRYLFRIAHNRLVDHWRGLDRQVQTNDADVDRMVADTVAVSPEGSAANAQLRQHLQQALQQLPREQREAFLLQQEAGLSLQDIALHTGTGRESVKSRLRYAVSKLRRQLAPVTRTPEA